MSTANQPQQRQSESTERLSRVFEASPSAMLEVDKTGLITLVNAQTVLMFGHGRAELLGNSIEMLIPPRHCVHHPSYRKRFFAQPGVRAMGAGRDLYGLHANGTEFPVEIGLNPIGTGEELTVIASVIDITERKRYEQNLQLIVDAAPIAMLVVDFVGTIRLANVTADKVFSAMPGKLVGEAIETLIPNQFRAKHPSFRRDFFKNPVTRAMGAGRDLYARSLDGTELPVEVGLSPVKTEDGCFVIASVIDTTERHHNKQLKARVDAAEAATRAKTDFLAMMSHELRTPLTGILGMIGLLREDNPADERDKLMDILQDSANSLATIVTEILDFTKIESGLLTISAVDFELVSEVDAAIQPFVRVAVAKGLRFHYNGPDLSPSSILVCGDPTRLRQIIINLVGNAIKFTSAGEIVFTICAPKHNDENRWRFVISDTGIGIKETAQRKLFEPFVQADQSTTREFGGTGLGLAICRRLAEAMGGEIGMQSVEHVGSTFWFTVRLTQSATSVLSRSPQTYQSSVRSQRPLNILVAEDNMVIQHLVEKLVQRMGHRVTSVSNGQAALQAVKCGHYDVVLMDMHMPLLDGKEATRSIRQLRGNISRIPIIALTADAMLHRHKIYYEAGINALLTKPIDPAELRASLDRIEQHVANNDDRILDHDKITKALSDTMCDGQTRSQLSNSG